MQHNKTRQALAQDVKREVLAELRNRNQAYSGYALPSGQSATFIDQSLIQSVKQEVLWELRQEAAEEQPYYQMNPYQQQGYPGQFQPVHSQHGNIYQDRAMLEAVKRDVMAQIEAEQDAQEQRQQAAPHSQLQYPFPDPALVHAVKQAVMFELQAPQNS